jgi:AraC-like DNA-binding protein
MSGMPMPADRLALLSFDRFDPRLLDASGLFNERPRHIQLGPGPLQGHADQLYLDSCAIRFGHFTQAVQVEVQFPPDRITIGIVIESPEPIRVNGKAFAPAHATAFRGRESTDVLFMPGTRWVTFNLPAALYASELEVGNLHERLNEPLNAPRLEASGSAAASLRRALAAIQGLAYGQPQLFGDTQWRLNSERSFRSGFMNLLDEAPLREKGRQEYQLRNARKLVHEAIARVHEQDSPIPEVSNLCRELRVARRTFERAFRETLGLGPANYFRIRALNSIRRRLLDAAPRPGVVARLAIDHGFWHLGRFAASYRALFGERPLDTLRAGAGAGSFG